MSDTPLGRAGLPAAGSERSALRGLPDDLARAGRCLVMGVVNVTPDSFSDGGAFLEERDAIEHGLALLAAGADLLDVGGESTRPGATRVDAAVEQARVLPVVRALAAAGAVVSVDTMRARTAALALEAGAGAINDVSGGLADPDILRVAAAARLPYVVMHWRGHSTRMQERATYGDVVAEVVTELTVRLDAVVAAGVDLAQVVLDPGLGFAKTGTHDWQLLAHLDRLTALGRPVLVGASRKGLLGRLLADADGVAPPPADRDAATAAVSALAAAGGAWAVRVHEVGSSLDAVRVAAALGAGAQVPAPESASPAPPSGSTAPQSGPPA